MDILSADVRADLGYALPRYSTHTPEGPETGTSLDVLARDLAGPWRFRRSIPFAETQAIDTEMETP
ncbi:hypothetical protein R3X27_17395 [Tropicimonas sp. TH_r6]|uniref:hypothetical protein n=1 Tax=Tropicimonas sp. TH_r6 TaxID=3082085 RepID=UPI002954F041|nr:hypothetical protein [Tropicimonas sp. TH_r6]MDV7144456.1 hypothetical protein [Tropicimonas sp. TH_r6]